MKGEIDVSRCTTRSRWFRLGCSLVLALTLALVLLLIPIAAGTTIAIPIPALHQMGPTTQSLSLLAHAQGGTALQLSKSAPATVDQGDLLLYTLRITNTGTTTATAVVVTDTIPSLGTWTIYAPPGDGNAGVSFDSDGDWYVIHPSGSDFIQWGTADAFIPFASGLPPGGTAELYFQVRVVEPVPDQTEITNSDYAAEAQNAPRTTGNTVVTHVNAPHWAIGKDVSASTIQPGEYLTYTITASNDGHLEATGLYTITDLIPQYTDYISSTPPATQVGNLLTWAFSETLAVGASREVTYVVQVNDPLMDGLSIINATYSVTGSNVYTGAVGDPITTYVQAPVLNIVKTDYTDPIWPGGALTYTLAYSNTGGADAASVVISDTIDGNTAFLDSSPSPSDIVGSTYYWDIGDLPAGDADTILITVSVASPLPSGTLLTNTANVGSAGGYGDQDIETTTVLGNPVLHLVKEANTDIVEPGDLITYTIWYSNSGDAPAVDVHITDTIDANTSFVASDPPYASGNYVWEIGDLWPSDTHQITVTVRVTDSLPDGTLLTNDAIIWGTGNITDADQAIVSVESAPILHLVKEASSSVIEAGDTLTYTIWYSNAGNAPATDVVITDTLPPELHFQSANPMPDNPPGGGDPWQAWDIGTLNVGGPYSVTLVVTSEDTIPDNVQLTNQVTMSSIETGTVTAQETITVYAVDLAVEKTASPSTVKADEPITYTITVRNDGHAVADNVRITDTLPISIVQSSVIFSASPGVVFDSATPPTYAWTTPTLDALSSITISISGRLVTSTWSASGDVFFNTVEVSSDGTEANLGNNVDQEQATGRPGDPYTVTIIPALAETTVGTDVPVTVTVTDQFGNPAYDGTTVSFSSTPVGSSVTPQNPSTSGGMANTTLSSVISATVTVTATAGTATDNAEVIFHPGPLHHFVIDVTDPQTAGIAFTVVVTAMDQYGNVVDFNDTVALTDTTLTLDPTISPPLVNGQVAFSATVYTATPADVITATSGVITGVSSPFEVLPGDPDTLMVTVNPATIRVCETAAVTTTITDQWGNLVPDQQVNLTVFPFPTPGGSANLSPPDGNTGPMGIFNSTLQATVAGNVSIFGEGSGGAPNNLLEMPAIDITSPAVPTSLSLNVAPNPLYTGGATAVVTATVTDCHGSSEGQEVTFTLSDSSLAWFPGPSGTFTATTDASGVATAILTSNSIPAVGTLTITGTVAGLEDVTTLNVESPPTPALTIAKTANPPAGNVRPGQTLNYTLVTRNIGGAQATGVVISDTLPAGLGLVSASAVGGTISSYTPLNVTGTLPAGEAITVSVEVTVTTEISGTMLDNQASVDSNETDMVFSPVVSHQVISSTAGTVFLPIVLSNWNGITPPTPTDANLRITDIGFVSGAAPSEGQNYHMYVVVRNVGTEAVTGDFWVDLYLNPVSTPVFNQPWQNLSQSGTPGVRCDNDLTCYGRAWQVTGDLAPDEVITLTTQMPVDQRYDRWPTGGAPYASRHSPIMALVDSWGTTSYGAIYENNETDNLSGSISGAGLIKNGAVLEVPTIPPTPVGGKRPTLPVP